jgi:hypothetical protein
MSASISAKAASKMLLVIYSMLFCKHPVNPVMVFLSEEPQPKQQATKFDCQYQNIDARLDCESRESQSKESYQVNRSQSSLSD